MSLVSLISKTVASMSSRLTKPATGSGLSNGGSFVFSIRKKSGVKSKLLLKTSACAKDLTSV